MTTIRVASRSRYTVISNAAINDARLSFRARGVLVWLLAKPDDWTTSAEALATQATEGRDAVRSAMRELVDAGYIVRDKHRGPGGTWTSCLTIYEEPQVAPEPGNPSTDNQPTGNQPSEIQAPYKELSLNTETNNTSPSTDVDDQLALFDTFWKDYPRKVSKPHARRAWTAALRRGVRAGQILRGMEPWLLAWEGSDPKFVPHAATWLNGERWNDDPTPSGDGVATRTLDPVIGMSITAFALDTFGDCTQQQSRHLATVALLLHRWGFGGGEIAVRVAAMTRRVPIDAITARDCANMPHFDRFQGDPSPAFEGDEPDLLDAMRRAYKNQRWVQR